MVLPGGPSAKQPAMSLELWRQECAELRAAHAGLEADYEAAMEAQEEEFQGLHEQRHAALNLEMAARLESASLKRELAALRTTARRSEQRLEADNQMLRLQMPADGPNLTEELLREELRDSRRECGELHAELAEQRSVRADERTAELRDSRRECEELHAELAERRTVRTDERTSAAAPPQEATDMARAVTEMAQAMVTAQTASSRALAEASARQAPLGTTVLEGLAEALRHSGTCTDARPVLRAQTAESLRVELKRLKVWLNDNRVTDRRTWLRKVRAIAEQTASIEMEYFIQKELGGEAEYQALMLQPDAAAWTDRWNRFEERLRQAVNLDSGKEATEVRRQYRKVRLEPGSRAQDVRKFLESYKSARGGMIELGFIDDTNPASIRQEIEEFREKISDTDLLRWLQGLPDFPLTVESAEADGSKETLLGRCRQYIRAMVPTGPGARNAGASLLQLEGQQQQERQQPQEEGQEPEAEEAEVEWDQAAGEAEETDDSEVSLKYDEDLEEEVGMYGCEHCWGWHPECGTVCPNELTGEDMRFDTERAFAEGTECSFKYPRCTRRCGGVGHYTRHHVECLLPGCWERNEKSRAKRRTAAREGMGDLEPQELPQASGASRAELLALAFEALGLASEPEDGSSASSNSGSSSGSGSHSEGAEY